MNRILHHGSSTNTTELGALIGVFRKGHVRGPGHSERLEIRFDVINHGRTTLEFTLSDALTVAKQLIAVASKMPFAPDLSGALANLEGTDG